MGNDIERVPCDPCPVDQAAAAVDASEEVCLCEEGTLEDQRLGEEPGTAVGPSEEEDWEPELFDAADPSDGSLSEGGHTNCVRFAIIDESCYLGQQLQHPGPSLNPFLWADVDELPWGANVDDSWMGYGQDEEEEGDSLCPFDDNWFPGADVPEDDVACGGAASVDADLWADAAADWHAMQAAHIAAPPACAGAAGDSLRRCHGRGAARAFAVPGAPPATYRSRRGT
jgi:hypothetical protein